jgi:hypothetical protein
MRSVSLLFLVAVLASCQRPICNQSGQPADSNPRNAAGELDATCPAYGAVSTSGTRCAEPPEKRCVYRAMGDCGAALAGATCEVCADVVCGCSCSGVPDGGTADAGCAWTCGR